MMCRKNRSLLLSVSLSLLLLGCANVTPESANSPSSSSSAASPPAVAEPEQRLTLSDSAPQQELPISAEVEIGDRTIRLEVATTPREQAIGLMYRPSLPDDQGMLFPFDPPRPVQFWMWNVQFPLDMIFLRDGEVKAIAANVPPCTDTPCPTYGPDDEVIDQVIELRGGRAAELGLQVGDVLAIRFLDSVENDALAQPASPDP